MKPVYALIIGLLAIVQYSNGQTDSTKKIFSKEFKWTISIPDNFENVKPEDWAKMQNRGAEAIENTYDSKVTNRPKIIFVFKSGQFNYLEANYQPFDPAVDGDYLESCKNVNEVLYQTFKKQMPGATIDTLTTVETIDNLEFQTSKMKIEYANKLTMHLFTFSRLFGKREFSLNIMYMDESKGQLMLNSWKESI
ncbi:MAG: hypothetical protein QM802_17400 [Agriterribacter sp.]